MDIITYALLKKKIEQKADLDSPHFTGEPTAPTPDTTDDSTKIATTEFVKNAIQEIGPGTVYTLSREGNVIVLDGGGTLQSRIELPYVYQTTAQWNSTPPTISEAGALYIWADYKQNEQGEDIPGIKVGDGRAYIIDLPFIDDIYAQHITDEIIHVTQEDRDRWDNKVTCFISALDNENLIFAND